MKKIILLSFVSVMAVIVLQASKGGVTTSQLTDLTNSPVSSGKCSNCHFGGSFGATLTASVKNSLNENVTSYVPGQSYTIEWSVNGNGAEKYGIQATLLKSDNSMAGTLSAKSTNTKATNLNNRTYIDQAAPSTSGLFEATWVAPVKGSGNVNVYVSAVAVDGNDATNNDQYVGTDVLTISENTSGSAGDIDYNWSYYPNPVQNILRVSGNSMPDRILIRGLDGTIIKSVSNQEEMELSGVSDGVYILEITHGDKIFLEKIIKHSN